MSAVGFSQSAIDGLINLLQEMFSATSMAEGEEEEEEERSAGDELVSHLGGEEAVGEVREAFQLFDKDGDGVVDSAELGPLLRALGHNPTDEEVAEMMEVLYVDKLS